MGDLHFYDTRATITSTDDLTDMDLKAIKALVYDYIQKQGIVGCVVVNPSRRQPN